MRLNSVDALDAAVDFGHNAHKALVRHPFCNSAKNYSDDFRLFSYLSALVESLLPLLEAQLLHEHLLAQHLPLLRLLVANLCHFSL